MPFVGSFFAAFPQKRMVQRAMENACRAARLRVRHPYDLRYTYATLLLMAHISPAYVQKQLGHSKITTTQVYADVMMPDVKKALDRLYC